MYLKWFRYKLSNTLQNKIDETLEKTRVKVSNLQFPEKVIVDIPNDISYSNSKIATEYFYIDDSLRNMLYSNEPIHFLQRSTNDRTDFELNVSVDDLIIFKSLTLNYVGINKKNLRIFLIT